MPNNELDALLVLSPSLFNIQKGRGNRNGLVQQIITYVRDGHTVTRKQWVRSEFAEHARKNEDEKRKVLSHEQDRERKKHEKAVETGAERQAIEDRKSHRKVEHRKKEIDESNHSAPSHTKFTPEDIAHKKIKHIIQQEEDKKKEDALKKKDKKNHKGDTRSSYGTSDQTKTDNKKEEDIMTQYTPPQHKDQVDKKQR